MTRIAFTLISLFLIIISSAAVSASDDACEDLTYCTQTIGGWGSSNGGPAQLRDAQWDNATGGSLVVGTGFTMTFTSSDAVEDYLPEGSTAFVLTGNEIDPDDGTGSSLHGQLTALQLNIVFSEGGYGQVGENNPITNHLINDGPFAGWSVGEFRDFAFVVFGGNTSALGDYTLQDLITTATNINENYVDCITDKDYLTPVCEEDPFCGDGEVNQESETCDDGNTDSGDGCSATCQVEFCGDGVIQSGLGEVCDDGDNNGLMCTPDYGSTCSYCSDTCQPADVPGPYCGDGIVQDAYEACDGSAGVGENEICSESCTIIEQTYCGDGVKQSPNDVGTGGPADDGYEACDGSDGVGEHQTCSQSCELTDLTYCGDGIVQSPNDEGTGGPLDDGYESCDGDAGVGENEICSDSCELIEQTYCGDGVKQSPNDVGTGGPADDGYEACDGSDGVGEYQECTETCTITNLTYCGDGIKQSPNDAGTDGPLNDGYESCDGSDGVGENEACSETCTITDLPYCGDGVVNQESEQCDGSAGVGENEICTSQCTIVDQCIVTSYIVSDEQTLADGEPAVLTYDENAAWTAQIENASWIWTSYLVEDPDASESVLFSRTFNVPYGNTSFDFDVASDNSYVVFVNGVLVRNESSANNFQLETQDVFTVASAIVSNATNTIEWIVTNDEGSNTPYANPAGLLYGVQVTTDICVDPDPVCGDGVVNQESEQCDGSAGVGEHQTCSQSCELTNLTYCGDGIVQSPNDEGTGGPLDDGYEACDGDAGVGDNEACTVSCTITNLTFCGDGIKQSPNDVGTGGPADDGYEACDSSDGVGEHQECTNSCELVDLPYCGDGIVNQESEQCDGSAPEGYTCSDLCELIEFCPLPAVNHSYTGPHYENESVYIDTVSRVVIDLAENLSSECVDETLVEYSVTYVEDEYCQSAQLCTGLEHDINWSEYEAPFGLDEEGCYVIDYRATDDNENTTGRACVFHDETAPNLTKTVGEPKEWWNGSNVFYPEAQDWCWSTEDGPECYTLTMDTAIEMSCSESGPEQSGAAKVCFEVGVDGDDYTQQYCDTANGTMESGACCVMSDEYTLYFEEESWHKLSFTCTDQVNKTSEADIEYFKVEKGSFEIELNKKWNLISIPFELFDATPEAIFEDVEGVEAIWGYDGESWHVWSPNAPSDLTALVPGRGYWVLMSENDSIVLGGSEYTEASTPPSFDIIEGWNLVGYYGSEDLNTYAGPIGAGRVASCNFATLLSTYTETGFASLITYWEPYNPDQWIMLDRDDRMDPGAGYWLYATNSGSYARSTVC